MRTQAGMWAGVRRACGQAATNRVGLCCIGISGQAPTEMGVRPGGRRVILKRIPYRDIG